MQARVYQIGKESRTNNVQLPLYYAGLDLGQRSDSSALAIVETPLWVPPYLDTWLRGESVPTSECYVSPTALTEPLQEFYRRRGEAAKRIREAEARWPNEKRPPSPPRVPPVLSLRYLHRWPLGTSYPQIVQDVGALAERDPLRGNVALAIDATGVGVAITDLFKAAKIKHTAITITGGNVVNQTPHGLSVPKRDLAMITQALLQSGRLRFAASLPLLDTLKDELQRFEVKVNLATGRDSYEAWREGAHDDIVLATCLACWIREWMNKDSHGFVHRYDTRTGGAPPFPLD